jgi:hypothetical protein
MTIEEKNENFSYYMSMNNFLQKKKMEPDRKYKNNSRLTTFDHNSCETLPVRED